MSSQRFNYTDSVLTCLKRIDLHIKNLMSKFKNEHSRFLTYVEKGLMIEPVTLNLAFDKFSKKKLDESEYPQKVFLTAQYIPLHWSLKLLLELLGSFDMIKTI